MPARPRERQENSVVSIDSNPVLLSPNERTERKQKRPSTCLKSRAQQPTRGRPPNSSILTLDSMWLAVKSPNAVPTALSLSAYVDWSRNTQVAASLPDAAT